MPRPVIYVSSDTTLSSSADGSYVVANGGMINITLPAPSGIGDGCDIMVINADSSAGKLLHNFPSDVKAKLYPHQTVGVTTASSLWLSTVKPGRYVLRGPTIVWVDSGPAGNDANDGLSPSTPLRSINAAGQVCQTDFDIAQSTPVIAVAAGTYTNDPLTLGGQPTGGNLIQISPYGGNVTLVTNGPCITIGDNAEIDIRIDYFGSSNAITFRGNRLNAAQSGHIYQHNNGLFDMSGMAIFDGAGLNDNAIFFDGPCPGASIAHGFQLQGLFDTAFRMDEGGGRFTIGGTIGPVAGTNPFINRLFAILGNNELIQSANLVNGGYASLGQSVVGGKAIFLNVSPTPVPGGITATQDGLITTTKW